MVVKSCMLSTNTIPVDIKSVGKSAISSGNEWANCHYLHQPYTKMVSRVYSTDDFSVEDAQILFNLATQMET